MGKEDKPPPPRGERSALAAIVCTYRQLRRDNSCPARKRNVKLPWKNVCSVTTQYCTLACRSVNKRAHMGNLAQEIRQFCSAHRLRLNKDLGQHFLTDETVLADIVAAARIEAADHIVEIGPGIGVLTRELLKHAGKVTAVEVDGRLIGLLRKFVHEAEDSARCKIINGNALQVALPDPPFKIVANIPYHITAPLLRHAFLESKPPAAMTLLIQREVAEKICDQHDRGMLTILVQLFGQPHIVRHVPASAFLPPPKVESSVLHITCYKEPKASPAVIKQIFRLAKVGFGQKRKMLRNSIGAMEQGIQNMGKAGIDPTDRPQELAVEQWIDLARAFCQEQEQ